ncbi:MAG: YifB family Mg chelatase-like AAA ATPase [Tropheryma whipplei]|nr:YifB family Mg chelatase-like AAA ATPase [Tropheryma whipplei]
MIAKTYSVALNGLQSSMVELEADIGNGLPIFTLVGLPDAALLEARERIRAACKNSDLPLSNRKITVNLSPASIPKHGSGFDLAIAIACLSAMGKVDRSLVSQTVHIGELGLDGMLRPVPGILPSVLAARTYGYRRVMLPVENVHEARLVPEIEAIPVPSLAHAAVVYGADVTVPKTKTVPVQAVLDNSEYEGDLSDISGNQLGIEALQIAAAGGHNLFFYGPAGSGKTMLASRLPALLPDLSPQASLEVSSVVSLSGTGLKDGLITRPPFEAPHHSITASALVGGGAKRIIPGAVSRASHGVLFLDEAPEFSPRVLNMLRQPLETGQISIHRSTTTATFPATFQLILAANPCPCGNFGIKDAECVCSSSARRKYMGRIHRPIIDRIDIQLMINRISIAELRSGLSGSSGMTTESVRNTVLLARERTLYRMKDTPWSTNSQASSDWLQRQPILPGATDSLDIAFQRGLLSMRGYHKVIRLAWTIADITGVSKLTKSEIDKALIFRTSGQYGG